MLPDADVDLVRRDPALRGLAAVLDADVILELLNRRLPEACFDSVVARYVRYKPGTRCLVAYRLSRGCETVDVHATAHGPDARVKIRNARRRLCVSSVLGPGRVFLEDLDVVVSFFPNDYKLPALSQIGEGYEARAFLRRVLRRRPDLWNASPRPLAYKPERRYVASLHLAGKPVAVIKLYGENGYAAARRNATAFHSRSVLRVARVIDDCDDARALAIEWVDGRLLHDVLTGGELDVGAAEAAGAALAELHAQFPVGLTRITRQTEIATLRAIATDLEFILPGMAGEVRDLARRLARRLAREGPVSVPVHGDFYAAQVLVVSNGVTVLDLDEAAIGDPAADIGLFAAHLDCQPDGVGLSENGQAAVMKAMADGYRSSGDLPDQRKVDLYRAVGLLRLAPHHFRSREQNWAERTEATVARAVAVLASSEDPCRALSHRAGRSVVEPARREVPVIDPFGVTADAQLSGIDRAIDPCEVQGRMWLLPWCARIHSSLRAVRVQRHKPGRRCVIEYDLTTERSGVRSEVVTLIGKVTRKGIDRVNYGAIRALWRGAFGDDSEDGVSIPEPVGLIPDLGMWLQVKVAGTAATERIAERGGIELAARVAEAAHKLHSAGVRTRRRHSMKDEMRILHQRIDLVAVDRPAWGSRLARLLEACDRLAAATRSCRPVPIHRDFYADHVIVGENRIYLIDFDLYCVGDPALDIGNFIAHLTEQSLRTSGNADAMRDQEEAIEQRFLQLAGRKHAAAVQTYVTLTMVRHIWLSTRLEQRGTETEALMELCERRLEVARASRRSNPGCVMRRPSRRRPGGPWKPACHRAAGQPLS